MKIIINLFLLIIMFISVSCGSKEVIGKDDWKAKFQILPNTGILAGKITLTSLWKDRRAFFFLTDTTKKLIAYDELSSEGYILFKNLQEGRYFIYADVRFRLTNEGIPQIPLGSGGYYIFWGYNCKSFYINIEPNLITYIEEEVPGGFIDIMPMIKPNERWPELKIDESCGLRQTKLELYEKNYQTFIQQKEKMQ